MMAKQKVRSAIYTRKSTDEGLDQGFNSLNAQREACAAYISSQKHEGWVAAKTHYDDGGISGATMERPALQALLSDIDAGRIAMVVVYKIDRLTRSLADFARLVEKFDAAGCSFVSVTQAFNTASSMGRLTLNVLLSFAQFEREVTAERIRDKIAASKKKGLWMGGVVPLGYDPHPDPKVRELVVNDAEAKTVRQLFGLYDQHGTMSQVAEKANTLGLRSKKHRFQTGRVQGGNVFSTGQIHKILSNPIYRGQIRHKDQIYPGRHQSIIDEDLWNRVQAKLQASRGRRRGSKSVDSAPAPLTGKLVDETGDRLTPTHTVRKGRRFRYYVSNRLITGGTDPTGWRLPASKLEHVVAALMADHLGAARTQHRLLAQANLRDNANLATAACDLQKQLSISDPVCLSTVLKTGTLAPDRITLALDLEELANALGVAVEDLAPELATVSAPLQLRRRGVEAKLVIGDILSKPDPVLRRTLGDAHGWVQSLAAGTSLKAIARQSKHHAVFIRTRGQLAFLSPRIQVAIRDGTQPPRLTLKRIMSRPVPLDWRDQERLYGI